MSLTLDLPPGADWSVRVVDLATGEHLASHEPDRLLSMASVGKVFVLVELAESLCDGRLAADQPLDRRAVPPVADSGLWQHLSTDVLPLGDVAALVGAVSDNWATNVLIDLLDLETIRDRARSWAPRGSDLVDVVRGLRGPTDPPHLSLGCAADLTDVLARLWVERHTPGSVGATVLGWLTPGMDLSMVASAWHQDPLSHAEDPSGPHIVNKTGTNLGVRADIGVVHSGGRATAYAVAVNWSEDPPGRRRDEVMTALRRVGEALRVHLDDTAVAG